jgi:BlaI family penicillinase repressor
MAIDNHNHGGDMTSDAAQLSRRERQIMEIVYERGRATAAEVRADIPDAPSYSAVRAMLRILEDKGHLRHEQDGPRYVFVPTVPREEASETALRKLVRTFFAGSPEGAMAALLDLEGDRLDEEALERLSEMIEEAKREGR